MRFHRSRTGRGWRIGVFFESRLAPPTLDRTWRPVIEAFEDGNVIQAFALGKPLAHTGLPDDETALYWGDILRAVGLDDEYSKLVFDNSERFRSSPRFQIQLARLLSVQGRVLKSMRMLEALAPTLGSNRTLSAIGEAVMASNYAAMHRERTALEKLEALLARDVADHPLVRYECAWAYFEMRQWKPALDLLLQIERQCPRWPRPWVFAHRCLASLGRSHDGTRLIEAAIEKFPEDWAIFSVYIGDLLARNRWSQLSEFVERHLDRWQAVAPDSDRLKGLLVRARWRSWDAHGAIDLARTLDEEFANRLERVRAAQLFKRFRLPVPLLVQDRYLCVATSVAMALRLYGWGAEADPAQLHEQMGGGEGVALWRFDRWSRDNKLRPISIRARIEAVRGVIDEGFPLLATAQGFLMNHMVLIAGYDDSLEEVEVIDPDNGFPRFVPYEAIGAVFGSGPDGLTALLPDEQAVILNKIDRQWIDEPAQIVRTIRMAMAEGDYDTAKRQFQKLAVDSLHRKFICLEYPDTFVRRAEVAEATLALARDEQLHPMMRFQAMNALSSLGKEKEANAVFAEMLPMLPMHLRLYRRASLSQMRGDWRRTLRRIDVLLEGMASAEDIWHWRSVALRALGQSGRAEKALEICLEIAPNHLDANLDRLRVPSAETTLDERLARARKLIDLYPRSVPLRSVTASMEFAAGHALPGENVLRETLRLAPRSTYIRAQLQRWYLWQGRDDLAKTFDAPDDEEQDTGETLPEDHETYAWMRLAWDEAQRGERGRAVEYLSAQMAEGKLNSNDDLELRQILINLLLAEGGRAVDLERLGALLPAELPGQSSDMFAWFVSNLNLDPSQAGVARTLSAWADRVMPRMGRTPDARFQYAYLDEMAGHAVRAARAYSSLATGHSHGQSMYRLGVLHYRQSRYRDAYIEFSRCAELSPGAWDALEAMFRIGSVVGNAGVALDALEKLIALAPYNEQLVQDYVETCAGHESATAVRAWLAENGARYRPSFVRRCEIDLLSNEERWDTILDMLDDEFRSERPRDAYAFRMHALRKLGRTAEAEALIEEAAREFPSDVYIRHLEATSVEKSDPQRARAIYEELFGYSLDSSIVHRVIELTPESDYLGTLKRLMDAPSVANGGREPAMVAIGSALEQRGLPEMHLRFLDWLAERNPRDPMVLMATISTQLDLERHQEAARTGRQLLALDPDHPRYLWHGGRAIVESNPDEALKLLSKYYALTEDWAAAYPIGRANHLLGNKTLATTKYREYLVRDPGFIPAITALADLGEAADTLFPYCHSAIEDGFLPTQPRVCVLAVRAAVAAARPLPAAWERLAVERYTHLCDEDGGTSEEARTLKSMLFAWATKLDRDDVLQLVAPDRGQRLKLRTLTAFSSYWRSSAWLPARV